MIYLPTLHTFAMDNIFTGSEGLLRFKLTPQIIKNGREVSVEQSTICAELWHGPLCYEKSEIEAKKTFPLSEEGRAALLEWLEENA